MSVQAVRPDALRVLIVDDERIARERLRGMLDEHEGVTVVAECRDGADAVEALRSTSVDAVFLDVQMPELDGFDVVRIVGPDAMPPVVFVTAYDQFAIRAFEVRAVDYLLKPFDDARLADALGRLAQQRDGPGSRGAAAGRLRQLVDNVEREAPLQRLLVKQDGRVLVVQLDDIDWIEASDNYVRLRMGRTEHLVRGRLSAVEAKLDPRKFARIHRSYIVNVERVREVQKMFRGDCVAILRDGSKLTVTAAYREALLRALGIAL
jgi:two-component system LytT family response regulator